MSAVPPVAPAGVRLAGLEKRYGRTVALHPVNLEIRPGELMVLVGPSGCGKTTILRLIAGLEDASAGDVFIGDRRVTPDEPADRDVAMVFQSYALYPHKTVRENLAFGLRMRRRPAAEIERKIAWAATTLGLGTLLDRRPAQLSGGQKQRVAFGRAMVREPRVFLFDEPLSNLDARLRADMRREIADLHRRLGATMVYVTHDQVEAMTLGQRIAVMRDGRIEQLAPPLEIYRNPATLYVAGFIGMPAINLARGRVAAGPRGPWLRIEPDGSADVSGPPAWPLAGEAADGEPVVLGVRAEHLALKGPETGGDFLVTVDRLEPLGNEVLVQFEGPGGSPWVARAEADWPGAAGDRVAVHVARDQVHVFAPAGARRALAIAPGLARREAVP